MNLYFAKIYGRIPRQLSRMTLTHGRCCMNAWHLCVDVTTRCNEHHCASLCVPITNKRASRWRKISFHDELEGAACTGLQHGTPACTGLNQTLPFLSRRAPSRCAMTILKLHIASRNGTICPQSSPISDVIYLACALLETMQYSIDQQLGVRHGSIQSVH